MTPLKLSAVWHRRFFEMSFIVSLGLTALFIITTTKIIALPNPLHVNLVAGITSSIALIASIVSFIIIKKIEQSFIPSLTIFALITIAVALTIWQTGELASPFLGLWALLAFMSGIFAAIGWVSFLTLTGIALGMLYANTGLSIGEIFTTILISIVPLIGGVLVWRENNSEHDDAHRNTKTLANELSEVATKSEIIINAIGDGVIAIDGKGTIELINPAAQEMLGWGKQDALMLHYKSILKLNGDDNHDLDPSKDPLQEVLNTNQQARANKLTAVTKSGKRVNISIVVSPIGDPGTGVIAVFRDVTKERAEEREQAEFISTASHEMRTPVASIEGYLGLALNANTATIDDRARGFIMKAHESAQHLGRLFQDLLDVSKSEDGRMTNLPKVADMTTVVQSVTEGLLPKAQEKGLRLYFKPTENDGQKKIMPVLYVNQDNDHIREVLDNLVENAIKYTLKGEVVVDIEGTDNKVIVSVKDSGLGIPAEDIPHLFQKFYRVENIDRQEIGGTGLGLYLSRRLAESMQGRLWVESTYGQGSTFFLELPRVNSSDAERLKLEQASQIQTTTPTEEPAEFVPDMTPVAAQAPAAPAVTQPATQPATTQQATPQPATQTEAVVSNTTPNDSAPPKAKPATTVPRGESLTREQIAEKVRQLEELAKQQREANPEQPNT